MTPLSTPYPSLAVTNAGCVVVVEDVESVLDVPEQDQEQDYEEDYEPTYHDIFRTVLEDLVRVTHCHGCGRKRNVCFFGYASEFCGKRCYSHYTLYDEGYYDTDSEEYDAEDTERLPHSAVFCGWCEEDCASVSLANSDYHHDWRCSLNPSGAYWPMGNYRRPCYNECIRNKPTVRIRGYNYW